jgi:hypothetical protein
MISCRPPHGPSNAAGDFDGNHPLRNAREVCPCCQDVVELALRRAGLTRARRFSHGPIRPQGVFNAGGRCWRITRFERTPVSGTELTFTMRGDSRSENGKPRGKSTGAKKLTSMIFRNRRHLPLEGPIATPALLQAIQARVSWQVRR